MDDTEKLMACVAIVRDLQNATPYRSKPAIWDVPAEVQKLQAEVEKLQAQNVAAMRVAHHYMSLYKAIVSRVGFSVMDDLPSPENLALVLGHSNNPADDQRVKALEAKILQLQCTIGRITSEKEMQVMQCQEELERLKSTTSTENAQLREALDQARGELKQAHARIAELQDESKRTRARTPLGSLGFHHKMQEKDAEISQLGKKLTQLQGTVVSMHHEKESLENQLRARDDEGSLVVALRSHIKTLLCEKEDWAKEREQLLKQSATPQTQILTPHQSHPQTSPQTQQLQPQPAAPTSPNQSARSSLFHNNSTGGSTKPSHIAPPQPHPINNDSNWSGSGFRPPKRQSKGPSDAPQYSPTSSSLTPSHSTFNSTNSPTTAPPPVTTTHKSGHNNTTHQTGNGLSNSNNSKQQMQGISATATSSQSRLGSSPSHSPSPPSLPTSPTTIPNTKPNKISLQPPHHTAQMLAYLHDNELDPKRGGENGVEFLICIDELRVFDLNGPWTGCSTFVTVEVNDKTHRTPKLSFSHSVLFANSFVVHIPPSQLPNLCIYVEATRVLRDGSEESLGDSVVTVEAVTDTWCSLSGLAPAFVRVTCIDQALFSQAQGVENWIANRLLGGRPGVIIDDFGRLVPNYLLQEFQVATDLCLSRISQQRQLWEIFFSKPEDTSVVSLRHMLWGGIPREDRLVMYLSYVDNHTSFALEETSSTMNLNGAAAAVVGSPPSTPNKLIRSKSDGVSASRSSVGTRDLVARSRVSVLAGGSSGGNKEPTMSMQEMHEIVVAVFGESDELFVLSSDGMSMLHSMVNTFVSSHHRSSCTRELVLVAAHMILLGADLASNVKLLTYTCANVMSGYFFESVLSDPPDVDIMLLDHAIRIELPQLHEHLTTAGVSTATLTRGWFCSLFVAATPSELVFRILDLTLYEGRSVLVPIALALLATAQPNLLTETNRDQLLVALNAHTQRCYDSCLVMETARLFHNKLGEELHDLREHIILGRSKPAVPESRRSTSSNFLQSDLASQTAAKTVSYKAESHNDHHNSDSEDEVPLEDSDLWDDSLPVMESTTARVSVSGARRVSRGLADVARDDDETVGVSGPGMRRSKSLFVE